MRRRNWFVFGLVVVVSLMGLSSPTSAQSQAIGFTDEIEACVTLPNGSMWLSTLALKSQLEAATGLTATVAPACDFANAALPAAGGRFFRCENCQPLPGSSFAAIMASKGYVIQTDGMNGRLPGALDGWVRLQGQ